MSNWAVTYDLGKAPASWDFLNWLMNAEIERREHNGGPLTVRFLDGPVDGFRADALARPLDQRVAILNKVMRPALQLLGAKEGNEDNQRSPSYLIGQTVSHSNGGGVVPHWQVPPEAMAAVPERLRNRPVITLREASYYPERNSDLEAWLGFAKGCGEEVIFVRDTAKADVPLDGFETCPEASKDFLFRAALMAHAKANLMVGNGPIALAHFLPNPWIMFRPLTPTLPGYKPGQPDWWERLGVPPGHQLPWATEQQKIFWGEDTQQMIESAWALLNGRPDPHPIKKLGPILTKGAFSDEQRFEHTKVNIQVVKQRIAELPPHDGTVILACYGPSLQKTWEAIRHERNIHPSSRVVTVSGAHDFLVEKRIKPHYHIDCDPRPHKNEMVTQLSRKTEYLMASCVHPSFVKKLMDKKQNVTLWHLCNGDQSIIDVHGIEKNAFLVGGGGSVGLRAICVMFAMGYRKFIIHGMDCSFEEDEQHAGRHVGKIQDVIKVQCAERWFDTSTVLVSYAQQFLDMVRLMMKGPNRPVFELHGDGLLAHMCRVGTASALERQKKMEIDFGSRYAVTYSPRPDAARPVL